MIARLQRLEDRELIQALHGAYVRHLADRQWDDMLALFSDDVVVDLGHDGIRRGRAEAAEMFDVIDSRGNPHAGYVLSSPVIDVTGDTATGVWTLHRLTCEVTEMGRPLRVYGPWTEARYACEYRRIGEQWRISNLRARVVLPDPQQEHGTDDSAEEQQ
ncbi:nuclear transport factor 2 family protein [Nocardia sp. CA-128927]|uniref:nuclear transport factor 2 family protein n=1 Tax=Nocardia sp. CA-128927 TaxID=3239975 RepID=UPI003D99D265